MKKVLLNLFALLLLPHASALGQKAPPAAPPAKPPEAPVELKLTALQRANLATVQQEVFRWQDRVNLALEKFSILCRNAQEENNWPPVNCNLQDLSVAAQPQPPVKADPGIPIPPPVDDKKDDKK